MRRRFARREGNNMKPTKCAFVTGGSRGIGSGVVKVLAREGYDIAFTYHSAEEEAKEMSEYVKGLGRRCFYYQASLEERDVPTRVTRQAIQDLGRLDVLVNNAGVTRHNLVTEMDADFIDFVYGVDFRNYILCTGEAARHMIENHIKGSIFFITSTRSMRAYPTDCIYGGLKAGLNRAAESISLELSRYGIRVNCIAPGATAVRNLDKPDALTPFSFADKIPLKRFGHPEEIGNAIAYLASDKAAYITGVTLKIDGGLILPGMPEDSGEVSGYGWDYVDQWFERAKKYREVQEKKQQEEAAEKEKEKQQS